MFAQESVMDIQRQAFQEWYIANHHDGDIHPNQQLLEWSEKGGFYFASSVEDLWEAWQAAKTQAVPEGFVLVDKHQLAQLMANMDSFGKKALGDDYVSFADIAEVLDEAREPAND